MAEVTTHAKLGASSSSRWLNCAGSPALCETVPDAPSSVFAEEGTAAHTLAEKCLNSGKHVDAFQGLTITTEEGSKFVVDDDMAEAVQVYVDEVCRVDAELSDKYPFYVEAKFHLTDIDDDMYGTNDACICEPFGTLYIFDYKHGKGVPVEAKGNTQMRYYALGALQEHPSMYESIEMVIVQPRCPHPDGPIRRERISIEELEQWRDDILIPAVAETKKPNATLACGSWCRWCDAAAICPAKRKFVMTSAQSTFGDNLIPDKDQSFPEPKELTPDELGLIMSYCEQIEPWFKSVKEYTKGQLLHGNKVTGYKIVDGKKQRAWTDVDKTIKVFGPKFGDNIYKPKVILTPTQLEKLVKAEHKGKKNTDTRKVVLTQLNNLVTATAPKSLAHISDKRPAVSGQSAETVFKD